MGLLFATTTGFSKSNHIKSHKASLKMPKSSLRHATVQKNHPKRVKNHKISHAKKQAKTRPISSARKTSATYASNTKKNTFLNKNRHYKLAQTTINSNVRIQSLISTQPKIERFEQASRYIDEAPQNITSTHGVIDSSFLLATQNAGLTNDLLLQLTNIFAWDIDFATNLHHGDQFTVVYAETEAGNHSILAAEFVNQGRILTAIRYKDSKGYVNYFSPEGKPMRKAFLSAPLDFLRISSGFDTHRKHPILNRIRAHKGIDYAARTGTPVKSAGDGKVAFIGNKGGYGQVLIIEHGEHYETLYAHLSDFKRGIESGDLVKQGEIIGYVGQTGLATGPHLHYEFLVDGNHHNPEAINMAQSLPLHAEVLADFKSQTQSTLDQINKTKAQTLFAKNHYR
jgi:murein DD-endopeptidase MepM/ murein hydrolase activator NlpD